MSAIGAYDRYVQLDKARLAHSGSCYRCVRQITNCPAADELSEAAAEAWSVYMDESLPDWTTYGEDDEVENDA